MLPEQLRTGAQEPRVLNIYRNYFSTTQENQCAGPVLTLYLAHSHCEKKLIQTLILLHGGKIIPINIQDSQKKKNTCHACLVRIISCF
jgi:hypothetical protein